MIARMLSLPVTKFVTKIARLGYAVKFIATEAHSNSHLGAGQLISRLDAPATSPCCLDVIQKTLEFQEVETAVREEAKQEDFFETWRTFFATDVKKANRG